MKLHHTLLAALGAAVLLVCQPTDSFAQVAGGRAVRLVVPFPAGGSADATARAVAQALSDEMKQSFIIDNKPGADGVIGADTVIRAAPDGQTLLMTSNTPIVAVPALRLKPPYESPGAFTTIAVIGRADFFLFAHPSVPGNNLQELIAHARANPGKLNYASGGATGILSSAQFVKTQGLQMQHIPYKGEALAMPDLLSGRVQLMMGSTAQMLNHVKDGKLKILATLGSKRSLLAPEVPTFEESGVGGMTLIPWYGLFGPKGLAPDVQQKYFNAVRTALQKPAVARQLGLQGVSLDVMGDRQALDFVNQQLAVWMKLVPESGIERD